MQHSADTGTQISVVEKIDGAPGKRALITGASSGLGLEFAELLAAQKVNLVLAARRREPMEKLAAELRRKHDVDIVVEPIDLAAPGAAARLKTSLDVKSLQIDILVNNAGYGLHGDFLETPIERTTDMIQLNITALTELSYAFGRDMAARDRARSFSSQVSLRFSRFPALLLTLRRSLMYWRLEKPCTKSSVGKAWSSPAFAQGTPKRVSIQLPGLRSHPYCAF